MEAHNNSSDNDSFPSLSGFWGAFISGVRPKLQHAYATHHHTALVRKLCERDRVLQARITSCTSRGASRWLTARPNTRAYLADEHAALALRQRINVPLFDDMPAMCVCGARLNDPTAPEHAHVHWCPKVKAPSLTLRHNIVVNAIRSIAETAGITARVELTQPTYSAVLGRERKLRPDLLLLGATANKFVDVAMCHSTSPYRVRKQQLPRTPNDHTLYAINYLQASKTRKYQQLAAQYNASFAPFVCDVFGAMGDKAHALIGWIVHEASIAGRFATDIERRLFHRQAITRLSVAIQRGAALGAVDAARRIRRGVMSSASAAFVAGF